MGGFKKLCYAWCGVFGEINAHLFVGKELNLIEFKFLFFKDLYEWNLNSNTFSIVDCLVFLDTLSFH